jgi:hypothetical protein
MPICELASNEVDPLMTAEIRLNGHWREKAQTGFFMRRVVGRRWYGIKDNRLPIYFMSFDSTPLSDTCTGSVDFSALDACDLLLELAPGEWDVTVCVRHLNVLKVVSGMANLLLDGI